MQQTPRVYVWERKSLLQAPKSNDPYRETRDKASGPCIRLEYLACCREVLRSHCKAKLILSLIIPALAALLWSKVTTVNVTVEIWWPPDSIDSGWGVFAHFFLDGFYTCFVA